MKYKVAMRDTKIVAWYKTPREGERGSEIRATPTTDTAA